MITVLVQDGAYPEVGDVRVPEHEGSPVTVLVLVEYDKGTVYVVYAGEHTRPQIQEMSWFHFRFPYLLLPETQP